MVESQQLIQQGRGSLGVKLTPHRHLVEKVSGASRSPPQRRPNRISYPLDSLPNGFRGDFGHGLTRCRSAATLQFLTIFRYVQGRFYLYKFGGQVDELSFSERLDEVGQFHQAFLFAELVFPIIYVGMTFISE